MSYLEEMFGLAGISTAITGGGGIIAGALAEALLKAGGSVSLWDISQRDAEAAAARLTDATGAGARIMPLAVDTTDEASVRAAAEKTEQRLGGLHVLINCAGGNRGQTRFLDLNVKQFEDILRLNLVAGLVVPTKVVAARWIQNKIKGCIINMASMASYIPLSGIWAYDAAKSAVKNLTMATAKEFAPHGIRVNALAPGFFIGKQNKALLIDEKTGDLTERGRKVISHTPYGRFGDASELAGALLFLVSNAAAGFVTGVTVPVDGGYLVDNI
ncbi:MAG: SDR family oxidoreductase [Spirochaetia bacterium]|jgi:NAD(P)-dependent dehydrogenase (short-subunit alcohol dehydrogenase family)